MGWKERTAGRLQVSLLAPLMALLAMLGAGSLPGLSGGLPGLSGGLPGLPGGGAAGSLPGHYFSGTYFDAGGTRNYLGYAPSGYKQGTPLPLVVALHGCTQSADTFRQQTKFDNLAEAKNFIVVYPEQSSNANPLSCWNWFNPQDMQRGSGEPAIIAGITDWVQRQYTVDPQRVFLAGFSAGGAMAAVMGATYPDRYAAIGIGSGIQYGGSSLDPTQAGQEAYKAMGTYARPMPTLIFHGGQDKIVPVANADKLVRQWQITADLADDGKINGSVPAAPVRTLGAQSAGGQSYTVNRYDDGQGREFVQYWLVPDMGHAWSGGCSCTAYSDPVGPDETVAMYGFFASHPMPRQSSPAASPTPFGSLTPLPGGLLGGR
jgi:poly(hydroxyalkanoate) depolymerase family esterase